MAKAKLTAEQVREIRALYRGRDRPTQKALAERYGVSQGAINAIITGRSWHRQGS